MKITLKYLGIHLKKNPNMLIKVQVILVSIYIK